MHLQIITPFDIMILYKLSTDTSLSHFFFLLFLFPQSRQHPPLFRFLFIFFYLPFSPAQVLNCMPFSFFSCLKISLEAINTACAQPYVRRHGRHARVYSKHFRVNIRHNKLYIRHNNRLYYTSII